MAQQVRLITTHVRTSRIDGVDNLTDYYDQSPNTAPVLGDISIDFPWNTTYTFTQSIITDQYTDADGDGLLTLQILSLPLLGTLYLSGSLIRIGQELSLIDMTSVTYIPQANVSGQQYASFTLRVKDNGISPNFWSVESEIVFNVIKNNDEPTVSNKLIEIPYTGMYVFNINDLLTDYNDPEGDLFGYLLINSIPNSQAGQLLLDDIVVTIEQLPLSLNASDINGGRLVYIDTGEITLEKDILIDYTVFDNI